MNFFAYFRYMKKTIVYFLWLLIIPIQLLCAQEQVALHFDSNKYELNPAETIKLKAWIDANKDSKVVAINGYTDEDGTNGFNDTLAKKRVNTIFKAIQSKVAIRDDFKSRSFGENFLQSKNKADNRKVIIYYILAKDLDREDQILGIQKTAPIQPKPPISYPSKLAFENPDGSTSEYDLDTAFMERMGAAKTGEKIKMENLNFVINTFIVVKESRGKLYELLLVLQKNPLMKIEIQGHLCCQPVDRLDLSTQRAKAIYNFLVGNGISKSRLSYKGFGSSQPIYPLPEKDETERAANRRVEIQMISN